MTCPSCGRDPEIGEWPLDCRGAGHELGSFWRSDAQIHASEKVVVHEGPHGEIQIPGRADRPMDPKLEACGWQRRELNSVTEIRQIERKTGHISQVLNYDRNSVKAERDTGSAA